MFKVAGRVLDFYDDPEFISNLSAQAMFGHTLVEPDKVHKLPDKAFAVKIATDSGAVRRWPIYNKTATALSGAYFCKIAASLPEDLRNTAGFFLKRAHALNGLKLPTELNEPFVRPPNWEVDVSKEDTSQMEVPNADALAKMAQDDFLERIPRLVPEERFAQANALFNLSKQAGVDLDDRIWNWVEKERFGPYLREELATRHSMVKRASNPILADTFLQTIAEFRGQGLKKLAEAILSFDRMAGLDQEYDRSLRDPFEAVFGGLAKHAASKDEEIMKWKLQTLAVNPGALGEVFEDDFIGKFTHDPWGTYQNADALAKRILTFLTTKIPSPKSEVKASLLKKDTPPGSLRLGTALQSAAREVTGEK